MRADAETFLTALRNLAKHKMRTGLTMLGMIFGVGAVIAMLSIGAGGEKKALEAIGRLGLRNVIVRAKVVKPEDRAELRKKSLGVSLRDAEAIMEAVPNVESVLPRIFLRARIFAAAVWLTISFNCIAVRERSSGRLKRRLKITIRIIRGIISRNGMFSASWTFSINV